MKVLAFLAFFASATLAAAAQTAPLPQDAARPPAVVHHAVSENALAQAAFDRGLLDYYAYNPEAAAHEFYTAADLDPHAAMAWWGIALSNAPNLNVPANGGRDEIAAYAIGKAKALEGYASPEDRLFIDATAARFGGNSKAKPYDLLVAYRDALKSVAVAYPNDPDAAALYAEAALYVAVGDANEKRDAMTAAERAAFQARVVSLLPMFAAYETQFPMNVGVLHFYIHAAEMANSPSAAVAAAKQLGAFGLPLDASHLTHMPGHTFFKVGMYPEALDVAQRSVAMDDADFACCHPGYYSAPRYYRGHNLSFLLYAAAETGHAADVVAIAKRDGDNAAIARALVAAGMWQDVVAMPDPKGKDATVAFARGIAYAKLGNADAAKASLAEIPDAPANLPSRSYTIAALRETLAAQIAMLENDNAKALGLLADASSATDKANALGSETPGMYFYSPHMVLAELAIRLGMLDIARAALAAELVESPNSIAATAALAKLGSTR